MLWSREPRADRVSPSSARWEGRPRVASPARAAAEQLRPLADRSAGVRQEVDRRYLSARWVETRRDRSAPDHSPLEQAAGLWRCDPPPSSAPPRLEASERATQPHAAERHVGLSPSRRSARVPPDAPVRRPASHAQPWFAPDQTRPKQPAKVPVDRARPTRRRQARLRHRLPQAWRRSATTPASQASPLPADRIQGSVARADREGQPGGATRSRR